ncbi:MAG: PSP1 domain-containing protein [Pirellulales bacterium]
MPKYVTRCGVMRSLGIYSSNRGELFQRNARVIVRTDRGLEVGEILCEATEQAVTNLKETSHGQILRKMTSEDENELSRMREQERKEFEVCHRTIQQLQLPMQLTDIEHIFGGERIVVYYLAENRVDFRELVKQLAGEFQTRIEMRQIGVRDEAKLLADYGDCGKAVCCNVHLTDMPPVSMRMAKLQKATLDPTKISGRCGRLKCCLRYEYDTYEQLQKGLPPVGSEVMTSKGRARVVAHEILASQVLVETEDHRRLLVDVADVVRMPKGAGNDTPKPTESKPNPEDSAPA